MNNVLDELTKSDISPEPFSIAYLSFSFLFSLYLFHSLTKPAPLCLSEQGECKRGARDRTTTGKEQTRTDRSRREAQEKEHSMNAAWRWRSVGRTALSLGAGENEGETGRGKETETKGRVLGRVPAAAVRPAHPLCSPRSPTAPVRRWRPLINTRPPRGFMGIACQTWYQGMWRNTELQVRALKHSPYANWKINRRLKCWKNKTKKSKKYTIFSRYNTQQRKNLYITI